MTEDNKITIGIDVGGPKKGFHAVALLGGQVFERKASLNASDMTEWCRLLGCTIVAVDAPCRWSTTGHARPAECKLAKSRKISTFATPKREKAESNPFYQWMLNGEDLYGQLLKTFRLFDGRDNKGKICLETFPQAAACALAGRILPARKKCVNRRAVLQEHGIDISMLSNIDYVDAALCAVTARSVSTSKFESYGDEGGGWIVTPLWRDRGN